MSCYIFNLKFFLSSVYLNFRSLYTKRFHFTIWSMSTGLTWRDTYKTEHRSLVKGWRGEGGNLLWEDKPNVCGQPQENVRLLTRLVFIYCIRPTSLSLIMFSHGVSSLKLTKNVVKKNKKHYRWKTISGIRETKSDIFFSNCVAFQVKMRNVGNFSF